MIVLLSSGILRGVSNSSWRQAFANHWEFFLLFLMDFGLLLSFFVWLFLLNALRELGNVGVICLCPCLRIASRVVAGTPPCTGSLVFPVHLQEVWRVRCDVHLAWTSLALKNATLKTAVETVFQTVSLLTLVSYSYCHVRKSASKIQAQLFKHLIYI